MANTTKWQMRGDILEACSCTTTCPCNFASDPSALPCEAILGFRIESGAYGKTPLDGLSFVFYARIPGNAFDGGWTLGVFLDQGADAEQTKALETVLSGQAGGWFEVLSALVAERLEPEQVPIAFEIVDGEHHMTVPGLLTVRSQKVPHPMEGQPPLNPQVSGLAVPFHTGPTFVRRAGAMRLSAQKMSFEHPGQSALIGKFDYSGP